MEKSVDLVGPVVTEISTTAVFQTLNLIQTGYSRFNRIGTKIAMGGIRITGSISPTNNGGGVPEYFRLMLIYDVNPNGALPSIGDLIKSWTQTGTTSSLVWDHYNPDYSSRFYVLADKRYQSPNNNSANVVDNTIIDYKIVNPIDIDLKLRDLVTQYDKSSSPSVIADIATGALYFVTYGSQPSGAAGYEISYTSRLVYHDI